jgi:hypothetical protein
MAQDIFLWLKRPVISEMRSILEWAHSHALRKDIRYKIGGSIKEYPSDIPFEAIVSRLGRDSKKFFRIIVRKGMNKMLLLDKTKQSDLLDVCVYCVDIKSKSYRVNLYLSGNLLGQLKRRFAVTEHV